jgi:hypothetical protein
MFSQSTTATVLNQRLQNSGQPGISLSSYRHRSPQLDQTTSHARGSASSCPLLSEEPLNWVGAAVLNPTTPHLVLNLVVCPLLKLGGICLSDTHSPPSLNQQNHQANTQLAQLVLLQQKVPRFKGGRGAVLFMMNMVMRLSMTTNMIMTKIIFQSPMLHVQYQP